MNEIFLCQQWLKNSKSGMLLRTAISIAQKTARLLNITCTSFDWKLLVEHARSLATIKLPQVTEVRSSLFVTGSWMISKNCALIVYVDCKQGYYIKKRIIRLIRDQIDKIMSYRFRSKSSLLMNSLIDFDQSVTSIFACSRPMTKFKI